jgi:hypothetical protein
MFIVPRPIIYIKYIFKIKLHLNHISVIMLNVEGRMTEQELIR